MARRSCARILERAVNGEERGEQQERAGDVDVGDTDLEQEHRVQQQRRRRDGAPQRGGGARRRDAEQNDQRHAEPEVERGGQDVVLDHHRQRVEELHGERPVRVDVERNATEAAVLEVQAWNGEVIDVGVPGHDRAQRLRPQRGDRDRHRQEQENRERVARHDRAVGRARGDSEGSLLPYAPQTPDQDRRGDSGDGRGSQPLQSGQREQERDPDRHPHDQAQRRPLLGRGGERQRRQTPRRGVTRQVEEKEERGGEGGVGADIHAASIVPAGGRVVSGSWLHRSRRASGRCSRTSRGSCPAPCRARPRARRAGSTGRRIPSARPAR